MVWLLPLLTWLNFSVRLPPFRQLHFGVLKPQLCFPFAWGVGGVGDGADSGLLEVLRLRERRKTDLEELRWRERMKTDSGRMRTKMGRRVGRQAAMM